MMTMKVASRMLNWAGLAMKSVVSEKKRRAMRTRMRTRKTRKTRKTTRSLAATWRDLLMMKLKKAMVMVMAVKTLARKKNELFIYLLKIVIFPWCNV
ncbi:hypothetical protein M407DRAFT_137058 [Tulasnella calospora MUT 4182]|uniref:Uncharacterized protein n=1 Tax=Tulasnella calospora MUT 4182 TaxID=1051891 RepID=A0A0C3PYN9_9AGAM|nr:hypothetical protein M407DRAFT_137058 [Tulasnella calospora MUT 4182]